MKKFILAFSVLCSAFCVSAQAQPQLTTYEVAVKEETVVLLVKDGAGVQEVPVTSSQIADNIDASYREVKAMTLRHDRLAELLELEDRINAGQNRIDQLTQVFKDVQAGEKQLAETRNSAPKAEKPPAEAAKQ